VWEKFKLTTMEKKGIQYGFGGRGGDNEKKLKK